MLKGKNLLLDKRMLSDLTPFEKGEKNEKGTLASPVSVPIHLKIYASNKKSN